MKRFFLWLEWRMTLVEAYLEQASGRNSVLAEQFENDARAAKDRLDTHDLTRRLR